MALEDLVKVLPVHIGVPDRLRVDGNHRSSFAPVHAAGGVDADTSRTGQALFLDPLFQVVTNLLCAVLTTAGPAVIPLIGAEENVPLVIAVAQKPYSREIAVKVSVFSLPTGTSELFLIV